MSRRTALIAFACLALAAMIGGWALIAARTGVPPVPATTGTALVGGPFALTSHTGERVTEETYRGKHLLIYFGYTFCPDVCPAELQVMSAALAELGGQADGIQPLFITIDPERDTVEQMATYVANFRPGLVGLTGTLDEVTKAARAYRVYFAKAADSGANDYLMDHSSIVYLMGPDGSFLKHFAYGTDVKTMADGIRAALAP